jgi:hypothetical protein
MVDSSLTVDEVIGLLGLQPHPEGGYFRETFRDPSPAGARGHSTAIYFLVRAEQPSLWHRVRDAAEVWHFYGGAPLELTLAEEEPPEGQPPVVHLLGAELTQGQRPQVIVPAGSWQMARTRGAWTLAGCTVAPAFEFASFELAPPGWSPSR